MENYIDNEIDEQRYKVCVCKICGKKPIFRQYDGYAGDGSSYVGCYNDQKECYNQVELKYNLKETINRWNMLNDPTIKFTPEHQPKQFSQRSCYSCRLKNQCSFINDSEDKKLFNQVCPDFL